MLIPDYYTILNRRSEDDAEVFDIALRSDSKVYEGHFPGTPVSPGVCNIQLLKECAEAAVGRPLLLNYVRQCRLTTLVTPQQFPKVEARISTEPMEGGIKLHATLGQGSDIYLDLKGEATFV